MKLQKITNDRTGHIILEYENDDELSMLWNGLSHSDNRMEFPKDINDTKAYTRMWRGPWESTTVELMGHGETVEKVIKGRGWDNPTWMTPLEDLLDLLIELRSL